MQNFFNTTVALLNCIGHIFILRNTSPEVPLCIFAVQCQINCQQDLENLIVQQGERDQCINTFCTVIEIVVLGTLRRSSIVGKLTDFQQNVVFHWKQTKEKNLVQQKK